MRTAHCRTVVLLTLVLITACNGADVGIHDQSVVRSEDLARGRGEIAAQRRSLSPTHGQIGSPRRSIADSRSVTCTPTFAVLPSF